MKPMLGHYRVMVPMTTSGHGMVEAGMRVRVVKFDPETDRVHWISARFPNYEFNAQKGTFLDHCQFLPDGEQAYAQDVADAARELSNVTSQISVMMTQAEQLSLGLSTSGELQGLDTLALTSGEAPPEVATDQSVLVRASSSVQYVRRAALTAKLRVQNLKQLADQKATTLKALTQEATSAIAYLMTPLEDQIGKLNEVVQMLNLYTGSEEEIVLICQGQPAPDSVPLSIRQGVLSMAEESAVMLDDNGMDSRNIEAFDEWLRDKPERINHFLPEHKGVVGFVARWNPKVYENVWETAAVADKNTMLHLLIRNGENIYRVGVPLRAGRNIIPVHAEYMRLFTVSEYDFELGQHVTRQLEPGSREYLEAEKKASAQERYYYRIALILQGLIDRTAVFQPLPLNAQGVRHISLMHEDDYQRGRCVVIEDEGMALADYRETFAAWRLRVNSGMDLGQRLIGNFSEVEGPFANARSDYGYDGRSDRFHPRGASRPHADQPLTIEARRQGYYVCYYERNHAWDEWREFRQRASVKVKPEDAGILLIDHPDVTPEIMRDFLARRGERHAYLEMVPLLKNAIRLLEQERQAEAPFMRLLAELGQSEYGFSPEEAQESARMAAEKYKYGQRMHRALAVDDPEAFAGCAREMKALYDLNAERQKKELSGDFQMVRDFVLRQHPRVLSLVHQKGNAYLAAIPEREDENVYVRLLSLRLRRGAVEITEDRRWTTLSYAHTRHWNLYASERLKHWALNPDTRRTLTGPERDTVIEQVIRERPDDTAAILMEKGGMKFELYSGREPDEDLTCLTWRVSRTAQGIQLQKSDWANTRSFRRYWEGENTIFRQEDLITALCAAHDAFLIRQQQERQRNQATAQARRSVREAYLAWQWEQQKQAFLDAYGPESAHLWEDHKKTINARDFPTCADLHFDNSELMQMLGVLYDHRHDPKGLSVRQALAEAATYDTATFSVDPALLDMTLGSFLAPKEEST